MEHPFNQGHLRSRQSYVDIPAGNNRSSFFFLVLYRTQNYLFQQYFCCWTGGGIEEWKEGETEGKAGNLRGRWCFGELDQQALKASRHPRKASSFGEGGMLRARRARCRDWREAGWHEDAFGATAGALKLCSRARRRHPGTLMCPAEPGCLSAPGLSYVTRCSDHWLGTPRAAKRFSLLPPE